MGLTHRSATAVSIARVPYLKGADSGSNYNETCKSIAEHSFQSSQAQQSNDFYPLNRLVRCARHFHRHRTCKRTDLCLLTYDLWSLQIPPNIENSVLLFLLPLPVKSRKQTLQQNPESACTQSRVEARSMEQARRELAVKPD